MMTIFSQKTLVIQFLPILVSLHYPSGQKSVDTKFKKGPDESSNPLFQYDMKFDSLKNYVDSVTTAVNQHAALINKIKNELITKIPEQSVITASRLLSHV